DAQTNTKRATASQNRSDSIGCWKSLNAGTYARRSTPLTASSKTLLPFRPSPISGRAGSCCGWGIHPKALGVDLGLTAILEGGKPLVPMSNDAKAMRPPLRDGWQPRGGL